MAKKDLLGCLEKRDLLNQSVVSVETLIQWGERYGQAGFACDAVDFYEKAHADEALSRLMRETRDAGDLFLYRRICRILGIEPDREEWLLVAKNAEAAGMGAFAAEAYRLGGAGEELAEQSPAPVSK